ncbi:MAG: hypothetical protein QM764_19825 [Chitinophagaceae bacterium]
MKNIFLFLSAVLLTIQVFANVNYITISKISNDNKLITAFSFIKDNTKYYDHWTNEWTYDKPKEDFINTLREYFNNFSSLPAKNEETYLLLGDIAHYLYNMDDTSYYRVAVTNYEAAEKSTPADYRCYWFLGYHCTLSNVLDLGIANLLKAETLLPSQQPVDFWNEYAEATAIANMPSHCIYAMDKIKRISGKEGTFEQQLGKIIYDRIVPVDKNNSYDKKDIWMSTLGDKTTFTSRPLGIKIIVDSTWGLQIYDYQKNQTAFIMNPTTISNGKGKEIHYTIAIIMRTANDNDKLYDYISNFVSKYPDKKQITFSDKYDKIIAYEIKEKSMYQEIGGAHLYMIGIERNAPKYPGLLLENPMQMQGGKEGEVNYYAVAGSKGRFNGKIYYAILLDTCEDIYHDSFSIFKSLFENQIIIE